MNGGGLISSPQASGHLENKYFLNQISPSSIRRESVSAIDDFFEDFLGSPNGVDVNVNVNMKLMSRPHNGTFGSNQHGIPPRQVPQVPVSEWRSNPNQQDSSGSFIEELFGPCKDDVSEKRLCNNNISKEPGMDVKPKFPASELPMALEKMSDVWDLQELDAIEIPDDEAPKGSDSERTSSISSVDTSSSFSGTTPTHSNDILSQMPPTSQGQLLPNGVHIKSELDLTPVMSCNFQLSNVLSNNIPSVVKMEPCLPTYSASCTTVGKPTPGLLSSPNEVPIRPNYLPLSSSNASIASSMSGITNAGSLKALPAVSNSFTVLPSQGPTNVPVVLQPVVLPPTPPDSQPNSPNQQQRLEQQQGQRDVRQTPPPPYPGVPILPAPPVDLVTMGLVTSTGKPRQTHPGCTTIKYNRKNNPDLEKRRIHYCEFPGEYHHSLLFRLLHVILSSSTSLSRRTYNIIHNVLRSVGFVSPDEYSMTKHK